MGDAHVRGRRVEQARDEIPDVGWRNPRGAEARLDVARLQIGGLHGFERLDIAPVGGIESGGAAGDRELGADIAAQIPVGGLPCPAFRIAVDEAAEFALQEPGAAAGHLLHARPVDLAGFVQRDGERLGGRLDMLDRAVAFQRPALEDGGLGGAFGFGIVGFEREQERLVGVAREGLDVLARDSGPYLRTKES